MTRECARFARSIILIESGPFYTAQKFPNLINYIKTSPLYTHTAFEVCVAMPD